MAIGNILGYATGAYSGWYKVFPFTVSSACDVDCANLKSAFFLDVVCIAITTWISISAAEEVPLDSSDGITTSLEGGSEPLSSTQEAFLWELCGTFRYFSTTIWIILIVTALTWIGWFPFLLFDTDWFGREIYGGNPDEGTSYNKGVRMGALALMLNSAVLGLTSLSMERLCRKWGAGMIWGLSNILMTVSFLAMIILSLVAKNMSYFGRELPPDGIVIAAVIMFTVLGAPLAVSYFGIV